MRVDRPRDDHTDSPSAALAGRECFEVPSESSAGATTSIHARSLASTSHRESRDAALRHPARRLDFRGRDAKALEKVSQGEQTTPFR